MSIKTNKVPGTSDEELVSLSLQGNRMAFEQLYERYFQKLVWFAKGFLGDNMQAEDAVQDVFVKVINNLSEFDKDKKFSTWIYTMTANYCRNLIRDQSNRLRILEENVLPFQSELSEQGTEYDHRYLRNKLDEAVTQLSLKEKNIFELKFREEMSNKDISKILRVPEGTVKSGVFNLLKKIAKHLKEFDHAGK